MGTVEFLRAKELEKMRAELAVYRGEVDRHAIKGDSLTEKRHEALDSAIVYLNKKEPEAGWCWENFLTDVENFSRMKANEKTVATADEESRKIESEQVAIKQEGEKLDAALLENRRKARSSIHRLIELAALVGQHRRERQANPRLFQGI